MDKKSYYIGASVGGAIGGYLPMIFDHEGGFSVWSIIGSFVGGLAGIYVLYRFSR